MHTNRTLLHAAATAGLLLSSFGAVLAQTPTNATIPNPTFEEVRATILEAVAGAEIPSMSVAVAKDGQIIWEESFGWADRERMVPATPHTMYSMASISKPLTATGLMILVERGEVDLDAPVDRYIAPAKLTAYEGNAPDATVRRILNHTSGLPVHYTTFFEDEPEHQPPLVTESIRRYGILVRPPGTRFQYSNFGYGLASHIIEKISGRSYADFMKEEVFLPLGMTHASIDVGAGLEEYAAVRHRGNGEPEPFYISDHPGASQAYVSAHDLIRFGLFHLGHTQPGQTQILSPATIERMKQDSDPNPDNDRYGLGWFLSADERGYGVVWHTGSMQGTNTILKFVPSEDIAVVVLINGNSDLRNKIPNDIIGTLLPDYGEKWSEVRDRPGQPGGQDFTPTPELLGAWEGEITTYDETVPVTLLVQPDGDVHVRIGRQMKALMDRVSFRNGRFFGTSYGTIPSSDARAHPHNIGYQLLMDGDVLSGSVTTYFTSDRYYGTFSSYIRLLRVRTE